MVLSSKIAVRLTGKCKGSAFSEFDIFVKELSDCKEERRDVNATVFDELISPVRKTKF